MSGGGHSGGGSDQQKGAGGAAALIGLIGIFVILYVLFLPSDVRQDILDENITSSGKIVNSTHHSNVDRRTILDERPGRLDLLDIKGCIAKECSHEIASFTLLKTTDSSVIGQINPFVVKNNIMSKKAYTEAFEVNDLANTENLILTFNTYYYKGILTVKLNGNVIYEKEVDSFNPEPIQLPRSMLAKSNKLEFSVSSVGWKFWETNEYRIDGIKIMGDVTDISRQKSANMFYVSDSEYYNVDLTKLKFSPGCNIGKVGLLEITLNMRQIYSGVPDCGMLNVVDFPPTMLEKGENNIVFRTEDGSYLIDLIEIRTDLKDITYPVYYFDLKSDEITGMKNRDANLTLWIEFVTESVKGNYNTDYENYEGKAKYSTILTINGRKRYIDTYDKVYNLTIPYADVRTSDNWVKVEPRGSPIEISKLFLEIVPDD